MSLGLCSSVLFVCNNKTISLTMDKNGTYVADGIPVGCVEVYGSKSTLPPGAKQTAGTEPMIVKVTANGTTTDLL